MTKILTLLLLASISQATEWQPPVPTEITANYCDSINKTFVKATVTKKGKTRKAYCRKKTVKKTDRIAGCQDYKGCYTVLKGMN